MDLDLCFKIIQIIVCLVTTWWQSDAYLFFFCACGATREDPKHYLLSCPKYRNERSKLTQILDNIEIPPESEMVNNLLYGNPSLSLKDNETLFEAVIDFIVSSKRFSRQ